jgi:hypothetical protein
MGFGAYTVDIYYSRGRILVRVYLAFLILTALFWFGLSAFRKSTGRAKWQMTRIAAYSILCSALAVIVLTSIVILF